MNEFEALRAMAAFLPLLDDPAFEAGRIHESEQLGDTTWSFPWAELGETASRFVTMAHEHEWVTPFDWMEWAGTEEARRLRGDPDAVASADIDQLRRLVTMCVRRDRFCEGALLGDFQSGLITRIVRRAAELHAALERDA